MNDATKLSRKPNGRAFRHAFVLCIAIFLCSIVATSRSYSRSDSLIFLDVTTCTDEGLLSLQIPLLRRAPNEQPSTQWMTYKRGKNMWEASDGGGKATLRTWMLMLDQVRCEGGMVGGFGYWKGDWQSKSRPGPFLVLFTPIWAVTTAAFTLFAIFYWRRIRFRLATMLFGTAFISAVLWLLNLQAPT